MVQALRDQTPVRGIPGVRISQVRQNPEQPFDVSFELESGKNRILVLGEVKPAVSPRLLEELAPWIRRMKALREDVAFALVVPALSPRSQEFCIKNAIDFLDLAGNVFMNVPGKFALQRLGRRDKEQRMSSGPVRNLNVFSGRSSRVLRVLLKKPKAWTLTGIAGELAAETQRFARAPVEQRIDFRISPGSISKALASLEDQLWIRRQGGSIMVPEPRRLLEEWAEKYRERYRWRLRSSFRTSNPFGTDLGAINRGLRALTRGTYAFTGAAAAVDAPFIDLDEVDIFLVEGAADAKLRQLDTRLGAGPRLRVIYPYDAGVFMYSRREGKAPVVSSLQAYLDLYARGGRDLKQADYLLDKSIEPRWRKP